LTFSAEKFIIKCEGKNFPIALFFCKGVMSIRQYRYMTYAQRKELAKLYTKHVPLPIISETIGVHLATIYRELKRGGAKKIGDVYSPEIAESALKANFKRRGQHACA